MIRPPYAPPEAIAALNAAHRSGARENALRLAPVHQVFTATLTDVVEDRVLAAAQETSWRDVTGTTAAEVAPRDGRYVLTSENQGPFVAATADALERAKQLDGDYELRVLSIPALYVVALWLHADSTDVLIPLAPAPNGLTANEPYDEASFTAALRPLAEKRSTQPMV